MTAGMSAPNVKIWYAGRAREVAENELARVIEAGG